MPTSSSDLIDMTLEEITALFSASEKCARCGSEDLPHPDEIQYKIGKEIVCADCYYHDTPSIGHPGMHRGY